MRDPGCQDLRLKFLRGRLYSSHPPAMGQRQPFRQLFGRFVWSDAVERHHGGGDSGRPQELGAPSVADRPYFDQVRAAANVFVETVNGHVTMCM